MSPILEITSPCSRWRTDKTSRKRRAHSRRSRMLPNTSSMNSWSSEARIIGGWALRRGRMNICEGGVQSRDKMLRGMTETYRFDKV